MMHFAAAPIRSHGKSSFEYFKCMEINNLQ